jgi:hypothetical protein
VVGEHYDNGTDPIVWEFETAALFNKDVKPRDVMASLRDGEFAVSNVIGRVRFAVYYKPDQYPCWIPWHAFSICSDPAGRPQYFPRLGLGEPSVKSCVGSTSFPARDAYTFQVKFVVTGTCTFTRARFAAVTIPTPKFQAPICGDAACVPPLYCDPSEEPDTSTLPTAPTPIVLGAFPPGTICLEAEFSHLLSVVPMPSPVTYTIFDGELPPGITMTPTDAGPVFSGTPTSAGEYTFSLMSVGLNAFGKQTYTLTVADCDPGCDTTWFAGIPSEDVMYGFATNGTTGVIVGDSGKIFTTLNGSIWTERVSGTAETLHDVIWDGTRFLAVGSNGLLLISADGITWVSSGNVFGGNVGRSIIFANGQYVVASDEGIYTSPDAVTWTLRLTEPALIFPPLNDVIYAAGQYIAVGQGCGVYTSPDGVVWTQQIGGILGILGNQLWSIAYGNGMFVAVGDNDGGNVAVIYSSDGVTWTQAVLAVDDETFFTGVQYGCEFIAVDGNDTSGGGEVWTSPDGINWTLREAVAYYPNAVNVYDGNNFIISTWPSLHA